MTIALSLARAARNPALEELFYFGPHPGNFAFEVGNPELRPEHALGFDVALRWRSSRASGEVTYFRNDISDYVFRPPLTEEEFASRLPEFEARFPGRGIGEEPSPPTSSRSSRTSPPTACSGHRIARRLPADVSAGRGVGLDYVRGTLKDSDEAAAANSAAAAPRRPPLSAQCVPGRRRGHGRGDPGPAVLTETPTDGYQLLRLYGSYSSGAARSRTRSPRGWTTRPTSCIGTTCRSSRTSSRRWAGIRLLYNVKF